MIFIIKMHWNDFYSKNALEIIFYYKNVLETIFTIKMHWKWFLL